MAQLSLGLIETIGLTAAVEAADAAVKAANVTLVGYEHAKGDGMTMVKVVGEVGSVNAAIAAAKSAAGVINKVVSTRVIARPADGIEGMLYNADTRGVETQPPADEAPVAASEPATVVETDVKAKESSTAPGRSQKTRRRTGAAATTKD